MKKALLMIMLASVVLACSPVSDEAKKTLEHTVNCNTADADMEILANERASVIKQIGVGVTNVVPVSAVIRIFRQQWLDGVKVAAGAYNRGIKDKMIEIHNVCGTPLPEDMQE